MSSWAPPGNRIDEAGLGPGRGLEEGRLEGETADQAVFSGFGFFRPSQDFFHTRFDKGRLVTPAG